MDYPKPRATLVLFTSVVLVLSFVAAIQQMANNNAAYAIEDEFGHSLITSCNVSQDGAATLTIDWERPHLQTDEDPVLRMFHYYKLELLDSSGNLLQSEQQLSETGQRQVSDGIQPGGQYTANLWYVERSQGTGDIIFEMLVLTDTVTCPSSPLPLIEQFENQGQCVAHANHKPNSGISKEDCKEAFKA